MSNITNLTQQKFKDNQVLNGHHMEDVKALQLVEHSAKHYHCKVTELVLPKDAPEFTPLKVKFISAGRDDVRFEVEDETSGEIFEEQRRYAVSSMPSLVLTVLNTILRFYHIRLDCESRHYLLQGIKKLVECAEGSYGNQARDHELFECNAVLLISKEIQYDPITGMK